MPTAYDTWLEGDCGVDEKEEAKAEAIAELAAEYATDPEKLEQAEAWVCMDFEADYWTDVTLALYDLHTTDPSSLLGSDLLTKLYRLAKVVAAKMDAELERMAADELDKQEGPDHEQD